MYYTYTLYIYTLVYKWYIYIIDTLLCTCLYIFLSTFGIKLSNKQHTYLENQYHQFVNHTYFESIILLDYSVCIKPICLFPVQIS